MPVSNHRRGINLYKVNRLVYVYLINLSSVETYIYIVSEFRSRAAQNNTEIGANITSSSWRLKVVDFTR